MSTFYTPPPGLFFRLVGFQSNHVIFSRNSPEPQVYHHPAVDDHPDQYFELLVGTGTRAGLYAIKSKVTDNVLFSRTYVAPYVGHTAGDGKYDDNWFKLEPGAGKYLGFFRLVNPSSNTVIVSRTTVDPYFLNYSSNNGYIFPDHYFSFLFEDMIITNVVFHTNEGKILDSQPSSTGSQVLENHDELPQSSEITVNVSEPSSSSTQYESGFPIKAGTTFKTGLPFVFEGKISLESTLTWGETSMTTRSYTVNHKVTVPPKSYVKAMSSVTRSILDIPITVYSISPSTTGFQVTTRGKYVGVTNWASRHVVSPSYPLSKSSPIMHSNKFSFSFRTAP